MRKFILVGLGAFFVGVGLATIPTVLSDLGSKAAVVSEPAKVNVTEVPVSVITQNEKESTETSRNYKINKLVTASSNVILINTEISLQSVQLVVSRLEELRLQGASQVFLVIDSPGGSVVDGADLITYMKTSNMRIDTYCKAICASMAAHIHQAGKTRYVAEKSILMFHPASGGAKGTIEAMLGQIKMFKKYVDRLDADVAKRSGIEFNKFKAMLSQELWLEASDALDLNLADKMAYIIYGQTFDGDTEVFDLKAELGKLKTLQLPSVNPSARDFK